MKVQDPINAGSIHDVPVGRGLRFSCDGQKYAVFRETYGHFYVFSDAPQAGGCSISQGVIDRGKIKLPDGHAVDLNTGRLEGTDKFFRSFASWVENGFVFFVAGCAGDLAPAISSVVQYTA